MINCGMKLTDRTVYKKRYGNWNLINPFLSADERMLINEDAHALLSDLFRGDPVAKVARDNGFGVDETMAFLAPLVDAGLLESCPNGTSSTHRCFADDPPLDCLNLLITNRCNLRCAHCYLDSGNKATSELTADEWIDVITQALSLGTFELNVSGGEPAMHPEFERIAEFIASIGYLHSNLNTNGTLLASANTDLIARAFVSAQVSLDDSNEQAHDEFRGRSGSFAKALKGIRSLILRGVETNVGFTLTANNSKALPELIALCEAEGVSSLNVGIAANVGRAKNTDLLQLGNRHTPEQGMASVYDAINAASGYSGNLKLLLPFRIVRSACTSRSPKTFICGGDVTQIAYVMANGDIMPCDKLPPAEFGCGNVRVMALRDAWQSEQMRSFKCKKVTDVKYCGKCALLPLCGGACLARSYSEHGKLSGPDSVACYVAQRFARESNLPMG